MCNSIICWLVTWDLKTCVLIIVEYHHFYNVVVTWKEHAVIACTLYFKAFEIPVGTVKHNASVCIGNCHSREIPYNFISGVSHDSFEASGNTAVCFFNHDCFVKLICSAQEINCYTLFFFCHRYSGIYAHWIVFCSFCGIRTVWRTVNCVGRYYNFRSCFCCSLSCLLFCRCNLARRCFRAFCCYSRSSSGRINLAGSKSAADCYNRGGIGFYLCHKSGINGIVLIISGSKFKVKISAA